MNEEYLTIVELSARLKIKPKTIKNKMATGVFHKSVHFFSPVGPGPRLEWSSVVMWLESNQSNTQPSPADSILIRRQILEREPAISELIPKPP